MITFSRLFIDRNIRGLFKSSGVSSEIETESQAFNAQGFAGTDLFEWETLVREVTDRGLVAVPVSDLSTLSQHHLVNHVSIRVQDCLDCGL